jgi:hypothetical protein
MGLKVGDKIEIIKDSGGHGFKPGEIVTVGGLQYDDIVTVERSGFNWWIVSDEYKKIEEQQKLIIHCPTQEDYNKIVDKIRRNNGSKMPNNGEL